MRLVYNNHMIKEFTLKDGQVIVTYDEQTNEIIEVSDWHGNDVMDKYLDQAEDKLEHILGD